MGTPAAAAPPATPPPLPSGVSASQASSNALDARLTTAGRTIAGAAGGPAVRRLVWGPHPTSGDRIDILHLTSPSGGSAAITTVGARLLYLREPQNGVNVTLTPPSLAAVAADGHYLGALVGRTANRLGGAGVRVGEVDHPLDPNDGAACLHGGRVGFSRQLWTVAAADVGVTGGDGGGGEEGEPWVTLRRHSGDGEGGHPGGVAVAVTYTLGRGGLRIAAAAVNDGGAGAAVVNLTHHAYWVLGAAAGGGGDAPSVLGDIRLATPCTRRLLTDAACVATGELGDPPAGLDLTGAAPLGVPADCFLVEPSQAGGDGGAAAAPAGARPAGSGAPGHTGGRGGASGGMDGGGGKAPSAAGATAPASSDRGGLRLLAKLTSGASGRGMRVWSDQPGFQLYTANGFDRLVDGYDPHGAVCVEASAVLGTEATTCLLQEGEGRMQTTVYELLPPGGG